MTMEELLSRIGDNENRICALETDRSADSLHNKMAFYVSAIEECVNKIALLENRLNAMDGNDACLEAFTDEEIEKWYEASGLMVKDVAAFLKSDIAHADMLIHGKIANPAERSKCGKWFRTRAIKYNSERNI